MSLGASKIDFGGHGTSIWGCLASILSKPLPSVPFNAHDAMPFHLIPVADVGSIWGGYGHHNAPQLFQNTLDVV